jgi:hypothetical protein
VMKVPRMTPIKTALASQIASTHHDARIAR